MSKSIKDFNVELYTTAINEGRLNLIEKDPLCLDFNNRWGYNIINNIRQYIEILPKYSNDDYDKKGIFNDIFNAEPSELAQSCIDYVINYRDLLKSQPSTIQSNQNQKISVDPYIQYIYDTLAESSENLGLIKETADKEQWNEQYPDKNYEQIALQMQDLFKSIGESIEGGGNRELRKPIIINFFVTKYDWKDEDKKIFEDVAQAYFELKSSK